MFALFLLALPILLVLGVLALVFGLVAAVLGFVITLPFRLLGLVFRLLGLVVALPFLLLAVVLGVGVFFLPLLPVVLVVAAMVWVVKRLARRPVVA